MAACAEEVVEAGMLTLKATAGGVPPTATETAARAASTVRNVPSATNWAAVALRMACSSAIVGTWVRGKENVTSATCAGGTTLATDDTPRNCCAIAGAEASETTSVKCMEL